MDSFHQFQLGTEGLGVLTILGLAGANANASFAQFSGAVEGISGGLSPKIALISVFIILFPIGLLSTMQYILDRWLKSTKERSPSSSGE
jgi:hypothetical protein